MNINSIRGNDPFSDIPDQETRDWFFEDLQLSFPPDASIIDEFSEVGRGIFETREVVKGDIADLSSTHSLSTTIK